MRYMVIGGTGFIGSHLVRALVNRGLEVVTFSPSGNVDRIRDVADKVRVERGSVTELADILGAVKKNEADGIVYVAAASPPWTPRDVIGTMAMGFINVLEAVRLSDVRRLVWSSSYSHFGPPEVYCKERLDEDVPFRPSSLHGVSYVSNELAADFYAEEYGLDVLGLRLGLVFGPGRERRAFMEVLTSLFEDAVAGRPARVPGGDSVWTLQYVKESANAMAYGLLDVGAHSRRIYNTCDEAVSLRQLAHYVEEEVPGAKIDIEPGGRTVRALVDARRFREELGYRPLYTIRDGVRDYIRELRMSLGQ